MREYVNLFILEYNSILASEIKDSLSIKSNAVVESALTVLISILLAKSD